MLATILGLTAALCGFAVGYCLGELRASVERADPRLADIDRRLDDLQTEVEYRDDAIRRLLMGDAEPDDG